VNRVDRGVIVLIVFRSFCDSAAAGLWSGQGWVTVLQALELSGAILAGVLCITKLAARRLGFATAEEEVAEVSCGSRRA